LRSPGSNSPAPSCDVFSPDMNPTENAFSKLKAYLRKLAERSSPAC
jgi:hypothetical protein